MKAINVRRLAEIDPGALYTAAAAGAFFGRTARAARGWCRSGRIAFRKDPFDTRSYLIAGRDLLAAAGGLMLDTALPGPSESEREREARGLEDLDAIRKLLRRTPR